jgi:hypothetical protein
MKPTDEELSSFFHQIAAFMTWYTRGNNLNMFERREVYCLADTARSLGRSFSNNKASNEKAT